MVYLHDERGAAESTWSLLASHKETLEARRCSHGTCVVPFQRMRALTTGGATRNVTQLQVTCRNVTTGESAPAHFGGNALWNCEDAGFVANPGDVIHIDVDGVSR